MQELSRLALVLCLAWAATLLYGEMLAFWVPLRSCSWPHPKPSTDRAHIAVVTDPQLMDRTSLRLAPESFAYQAAQFYTDLYMRRSFLASILPFNPDRIMFLGDQFDGGLLLSDEEWHESFNRFRHVFCLQRNIDVNYLCGNHDIGYAGFHMLNPKVISRYEEGFGKRNYRFNVQNVEFIAIDAQALDGPLQGKPTLMTWEFIQNISKETTSHTRVLLTHIPLYRRDETPCGPHRSSPIINQRVSYAGTDKGISYQNYLRKETSKRLLDLIKPVLVLSGHDHDQCTVTHSTSFGPVTEHTLGTFSWQQGNLYPSFMLLSVTANLSSNLTEQESKVSTHLCFLPMQTHIYLWYLILFVLTLLLVTFWPINGFECFNCSRLIGFIKVAIVSTQSKEKDEDENCEYEEIWDAEGSMHLIKKVKAVAPRATSTDFGLAGRGTVTARPQARKHMQEADPSITLEVSTDAKHDARNGSQFGKSVARKVVQRLFRVIRLLTVIAAVNVPLYMMMMFKDWVER